MQEYFNCWATQLWSGIFIATITKNICNTFSSPANNKYAWLGEEKAEIIFLNEFRWSQEMIAWKELLILLDGKEVHLTSPKNHIQTTYVSTKTPL